MGIRVQHVQVPRVGWPEVGYSFIPVHGWQFKQLVMGFAP
jgi:siderophore synthetase component